LKRSVLFVALTLSGIASAQPTATEFQALRKKHGIQVTQPVSVLDKFVGAKIMEITGTIKGTFSTPDFTGVLMEHKVDDTIALETDAIPEWVFMRELKARAIIRAERKEELGGLRCVLIALAPAELVPDLVPASSKPVTKTGTSKQAAANRGKRPAASRGTIGRSSAPRSWSMGRSEVLPYYVNFVRQQNPRLSEKEATRIADNIIGYCLAYGVDARLIMAIVLVESGFNPTAVSSKGAAGLGQLMPGTAGDLGVNNRFHIEQNVYGMVRLIRQHLEKYTKETGDPNRAMQLALAAYNAGAGAVKKYNGIPPYKQTVNYVKKVSEIYRKLTGG
jgi:hypothetical protein